MHQPHRKEKRRGAAAARKASVDALIALALAGEKGSKGALAEIKERGIHLPADADVK